MANRLERVAEAVAEALRQFRRDNTSVAPLAQTFREELGPTERLFIAGAAATALDPEYKDQMAEALAFDAASEAVVVDPRGCTEKTYALIIERHRSVGNEDKARQFEAVLERIRARWAADDAVKMERAHVS